MLPGFLAFSVSCCSATVLFSPDSSDHHGGLVEFRQQRPIVANIFQNVQEPPESFY